MRKLRALLGSGCWAMAACTTGVIDDPFTTALDPSTSSTPDDSTTAPADPTTSGALDTGSSGAETTTSGVDGTTLAVESTTGDVILCGNDSVDEGETCDGSELGGQDCVSQGFDAGELACAADCSAYDTQGCYNYNCGNTTIEGTEACDGLQLGGATCQTEGFDSGSLACNLDCQSFDTADCGMCGNVIVDGDEACDGIVLFGQTCESQGFDYGELGCAADCLAFDTSGCGVCGDGTQGGTEACDGGDLAGESCASLGLFGGTLACDASCQFDFSACDVPGTPFGSDVGYNGFELMPGVTTCDNILATGTPTGLTDDSQLEVPIGFSFPFYGVDYTNVTIQSNGVLRWGDASYLTYGNTCLPSPVAPSTNNLYVFWDDLNPGLGTAEIYYQTLGAVGSRRLVVQWEIAHYGGDSVDLMRFQAVLHENTGNIDVCYVDTLSAGNVGDNGFEATSGIQLDSATGFDYSCNTADLVNGLQLLYVPL